MAVDAGTLYVTSDQTMDSTDTPNGSVSVSMTNGTDSTTYQDGSNTTYNTWLGLTTTTASETNTNTIEVHSTGVSSGPHRANDTIPSCAAGASRSIRSANRGAHSASIRPSRISESSWRRRTAGIASPQ